MISKDKIRNECIKGSIGIALFTLLERILRRKVRLVYIMYIEGEVRRVKPKKSWLHVMESNMNY